MKDIKVIFQGQKWVLQNDTETWVKKWSNGFDVAMARYDEVGVCEMVDYMCLKMEVYQLQKKKKIIHYQICWSKMQSESWKLVCRFIVYDGSYKPFRKPNNLNDIFRKSIQTTHHLWSNISQTHWKMVINIISTKRDILENTII